MRCSTFARHAGVCCLHRETFMLIFPTVINIFRHNVYIVRERDNFCAVNAHFTVRFAQTIGV